MAAVIIGTAFSPRGIIRFALFSPRPASRSLAAHNSDPSPLVPLRRSIAALTPIIDMASMIAHACADIGQGDEKEDRNVWTKS